MALQRSADNGIHNRTYESAQHDERGIELADVSTGIYDTLGHRDCDSHTYGDITTAPTKTKSGTNNNNNNNARKSNFNNAATVTISGINVERAVYKVIVGLLLFFTLLCTLSGVIVYHVISAKLTDNDSKTSQHQDVAPKTNITDVLAILAEFSQSNKVWKEQMSDSLSESRDDLTSMNKRLEKMDTVVQAVRANQSNSNTAIDRRLEELDNDVQAVQDKQNSSETAGQAPVAFTARFAVDTRPFAGKALIFDTIVLNAGDAYDTTDGMFTAPVAGTYTFSVQVCMAKDKIIKYSIQSKTTVYSASFYGDTGYHDVCSSVSTVAVLTAGEKIWVKCIYTDSLRTDLETTASSYWSMFSGALVHPAL